MIKHIIKKIGYHDEYGNPQEIQCKCGWEFGHHYGNNSLKLA